MKSALLVGLLLSLNGVPRAGAQLLQGTSASPSPAVRVDPRPARPSQWHIWVPGYWRWEGQGHVWIPGHYAAILPTQTLGSRGGAGVKDPRPPKVSASRTRT